MVSAVAGTAISRATSNPRRVRFFTSSAPRSTYRNSNAPSSFGNHSEFNGISDRAPPGVRPGRVARVLCAAQIPLLGREVRSAAAHSRANHAGPHLRSPRVLQPRSFSPTSSTRRGYSASVSKRAKGLPTAACAPASGRARFIWISRLTSAAKAGCAGSASGRRASPGSGVGGVVASEKKPLRLPSHRRATLALVQARTRSRELPAGWEGLQAPWRDTRHVADSRPPGNPCGQSRRSEPCPRGSRRRR